MDDIVLAGSYLRFALMYGGNIFIWKFPLVGTKLKQNGCSAGQIINLKMKLYLLLTKTDGYTSTLSTTSTIYYSKM